MYLSIQTITDKEYFTLVQPMNTNKEYFTLVHKRIQIKNTLP